MQSVPAELKSQEFTFDAMNLQVGVRLQLITHRGLKPVQHFSMLIGYLRDEYLIVKIPMENAAPIALADGERVTIRVFSGTNVCSFACTVERLFGRPLLYAHLSFPKAIQGTSLRAAMRVKADIPARVSPVGADSPGIACLLANVSVSGARIESAYKLPESGEIDVQFTLAMPLEEKEVQVRTRAQIRNASTVPGEQNGQETFAYGVQFVDLEPMHYTMLQNLTYEALLGDRQKIV
jgi:c-di-GMP-binding flagellar brake protein YcgR